MTTGNNSSNNSTNNSNGSSVTAAEQAAENAGFLGSGWSFPPTFNAGDFQLNMTQQNNNINQSIKQILLTPRGERMMTPGFGSILHSFVFRTFTTALQSEITDAVKVALRDNEPRIKVDSVLVSVENDESTLLSVIVTYTIVQTNSRHNHVYPFALTEANQLSLNDGGL
jgi:phage baseplate assembly protein W